jgi:hypothetical protein
MSGFGPISVVVVIVVFKFVLPFHLGEKKIIPTAKAKESNAPCQKTGAVIAHIRILLEQFSSAMVSSNE